MDWIRPLGPGQPGLNLVIHLGAFALIVGVTLSFHALQKKDTRRWWERTGITMAMLFGGGAFGWDLAEILGLQGPNGMICGLVLGGVAWPCCARTIRRQTP